MWVYIHTVAAQVFTHLSVVSSRQQSYDWLRCEGKGRDSTMKLYHKIFKSRDDMSVYLENMDSLISYDEELLNRLTNACNTDELHDAKCSILRDFRAIYAFDASDAEFPEPIGHFDDEKEKIKFIRKKILLQDIAFYLGNVYKRYHSIIYQTHNRLPEIELKRLAIDYNEIYRKAMEDYIATLVTGGAARCNSQFCIAITD